MSDLHAREAYILIAYGEDLFYHFNAIFAALRLIAVKRGNDHRPVVIYTDRPEIFARYPVTIIPIAPAQMTNWSLHGRYHFRIKNRVMHDILLRGYERVLFTDSDFICLSDPAREFSNVNATTAVMHENEGRAVRRSASYGKVGTLQLSACTDGCVITGNETMWGSAVMGLHQAMLPAIDLADEMICEMRNRIAAPTIEQFALGLALGRVAEIRASSVRYRKFSTSGKKRFARQALFDFFASAVDASVANQIEQAKHVRLSRPIAELVRQKIAGRIRPTPDFACIRNRLVYGKGP